ncbi:hypothetical protein FQN54_000075 [Arachnomyces sp. PD_36]|nr:hypothetical protein FQN54_000075 [Arachnomyces sp. PD_36]
MLAASYPHCQDNSDSLNPILLQQLQQLHQRQQEQQQLLELQHQQQQQSFPTLATEDFPCFASPPSSTPASPPLSPPDFSTSSSVTAGSVDLSAYLDNSSGFSGHPSMPSAATQSAGTSQTPPIRVHQSSPPFGGQYWNQGLQSSMVPHNGSNWESDATARLLSPAKIHQNGSRRTGFYNQHKRASSNSSAVSAASDSFSPLGHATSAAPANFSPSAFNGYESYNTPHQSTVSKALPTPEHTPVQNNFLVPPFLNYDGDQGEADMAMRRAILEQQATAEDEPSFNYSLAPSVSTLSHNSPATPQTTYAEDFEDSKTIPHGEDRTSDVDRWMDDCLHLDAFVDFSSQNGNPQMHVPKLNRTMSDIYQDELYNPMVSTTSQIRNPSNMNVNMTSPYRNVFADRLQAARQGHISARSQSPTSMNRERSPFRQGSPFAQSAGNYNATHMQQPSQLTSEMQMGQGSNVDAMGLVQQQENRTEPKTISPKDALLEYNESVEDGDMPLFPPTQDTTNGQSPSTFQPTPNVTSMGTFPNHYAQHQAMLSQQYPFIPQQQQPQPQAQPQQAHNNMHQAMDFASQVPHTSTETPMNTTSSPASQRQITISTPNNHIQRPANTSADSGTYTCTYHGCTLRFETPAKLQKHKREAHRQTTPGSHGGAARESPSSETSLAMRNSQAGPHRCDRINPSTGKPCNSIFSRPYDLTRHEDTIHNARKQKVRCHLCTEEKTFSRNDALTRHMRVVHPEVDWPGKQKRKGRD